MNPSSISRRIEASISAANQKDFETSLIHFFPALDKTAKKRRNEGVGNRIRKFLSDQEAIITAVGTGNIYKDIQVDGVSFPAAIYKFGRTAIAHEGELDRRLNINDNGALTIGEVWNLPSSYITGLIVSVMCATENKNEYIDSQLSLTIYGHKFQINELWGAQNKIEELICKAFDNPSLFD